MQINRILTKLHQLLLWESGNYASPCCNPPIYTRRPWDRGGKSTEQSASVD